MNERVYFNSCLTSKPAPEVIKVIREYLSDKFYFPADFIREGVQASDIAAGLKKSIAQRINVRPENIHFTTGGTSANNLAIKGFLTANSDKGTHIICAVNDYPDILTNAAFFEESGFEVTYLSVDSEGFINLDELERSVKPDTVLFMTTLVNHTTGTIQPIHEVKAILGRYNHKVYIHADACEAFGRIPIDLETMGIDMMSVSAHKIHGPQGAGFLYLNDSVSLGQIKHGVARFDNYETGGMNIALLAGMTKAIEMTIDNFYENTAKISFLNERLYKGISKNIPNILVNGPLGEKRAPHNLNISFDYIEGEAIMMMLDLNNISVATGSACASKGLQPSYVLMSMGRNHEQSHSSMKFTISRYNTEKEIDYTVEKLTEIVKELRRRSSLYNI